MGITVTEEYIFNNWEDQIRIRSKRRRKRDIIEGQDKKLIRLFKEDRELSKRCSELPMIDLKPPIQRGYKRYFIVREDVRRSKQGVFYENLLRKINTIQHSATKEFRQKKRRLGRRTYEARGQQLKVVLPHEINKMKLTPQEMLCFTFKIKIEVRHKRIYQTQYFEMTEPWRYVLRIRPNMIDKIRTHDEELEQRLAELNDKVYKNKINYARLSKLRDWGYDRWDDLEKLRYANPLKDKSLYQILEECE